MNEANRQHRTTEPPFTFRLPKPGQGDPYFNAPRTWWNERILPNKLNGFKPPIRSIVDRRVGATRGIRFIVYESALEYFKKLEERQRNQAENQQVDEPIAA